MKLKNSMAELSEAEIGRFESEIGIEIPVEYRDFLLRNNGGTPDPGWYSMNGEYEDEISYFFAINASDRHSDLALQIENYRDWILPDYLPIAVCGGGDVLCLCLRKEEPGCVYHWNHELANAAGEPTENNMTKLCNSLTEFVDAVTTLEDLEERFGSTNTAVVVQSYNRPWWKFW